MAHTERVVVLVDMDCFYCQVEEKLDPQLEGKPIAVVQYNAWRGGGIIAVNYPARDKGVTRHMRGDEAKEKCPDIILARVPEVRGKADLTKYREAGKQVAEVLQTFTNLLERASVDEAYLDITEEVKKRLEQGLDQIRIEKLANTFVVGCDTKQFINSLKENRDFSESNIKLAIGGIIAEELRAEVLKRTGYKCSAGVAHNKILAKLVCGLHKPNKQTLLPQNAISELYKDMPIKKIKSLGGKFGSALAEELQITNMGELVHFGEKELIKRFDEKNGKWLYNIARGIDLEPVTVRLISKSIGCCKKFPGKTALTTSEDVEHWINELASEISERLEKDLEENNRRAKQMVVSFTQEVNNRDSSSSRTHPLQSYDQAKIARSATDVIRRFCLRADGSYCITFMGLSVGNFQDLKNSVDISSMFKNMNKKVDIPKSLDVMLPNLSEKPKSTCVDAPQKGVTESRNKSRNSFLQSWAAKKEEHMSFQSSESTASLDSKVNKQVIEQQITPGQERNKPELSENKNLLKINGSVTNSFFLNYFMTEGRHFLKSSTSYVIGPKKIANPVQTPTPSTGASLEVTCSECNKTIAASEYQSHKDYHFALNLDREETLAYKASNYEENRNKVKDPNSIVKLLGNSDEGQEPEYSEFCGECKKQIKISELAKHLDEHEHSKSSTPVKTFNSESVNKPNCKLALTDYKDPDQGRESSSRICEDEDMFLEDSAEKINEDSLNEPHEETSNHSVYSADTEELNEDTKSLIYFEDVFSESDSSQPLFRSQETRVSVNSKENNDHSNQCEEIPNKNDSAADDPGSDVGGYPTSDVGAYPTSESAKIQIDKDPNNEIPTCSKQSSGDNTTNVSNSFFLNYFLNEKKNARKTPSINLWKTLEEAGLLISKKMDHSPIDLEPKELKITPEMEDKEQNCLECNKKIPSSEYVSHLDYHFALKMVKDEAHLYKAPTTPKEEKPSKVKPVNKKTSQANKRKLNDSNKILTFLQKTKSEDLDQNNSEVCEECNKRIKLDEFVGHADYHAAKRLHSELNSPKKVVATSVKIKDKKSKSVMNLRPISNFFKA